MPFSAYRTRNFSNVRSVSDHHTEARISHAHTRPRTNSSPRTAHPQ